MNTSKRQPDKAPAPGVYPGQPFEQYARIAAVNNSLLQEASRSAAHARHWLDTEDSSDSDALRFGRLLHAAILEPEYFAKTATLVPEINKRVPAERAAREALVSTIPHGLWMTEDDYESIGAMRLAVRQSELASKISGSPGQRECTMVWESDKITCKARVDKCCPSVRLLVDIKTTRSADPRDFERSCIDYGYFEQAAHYTEGAGILWPGQPWRYAIIAIEKEAPFAVVVYMITPEAVEYGQRRNVAAWNTLRKALETNQWPSYSTNLAPLSPPMWAMRQVGMS